MIQYQRHRLAAKLAPENLNQGGDAYGTDHRDTYHALAVTHRNERALTASSAATVEAVV